MSLYLKSISHQAFITRFSNFFSRRKERVPSFLLVSISSSRFPPFFPLFFFFFFPSSTKNASPFHGHLRKFFSGVMRKVWMVFFRRRRFIRYMQICSRVHLGICQPLLTLEREISGIIVSIFLLSRWTIFFFFFSLTFIHRWSSPPLANSFQ